MVNTAISSCRRVWINARPATIDPAVAAPYGELAEHAIGVRDGKIATIVPISELPEDLGPAEVIDARGAWITPGLVDCHTHLVYGGNRSREIELRRSGVSYEEIARQGGGILSTVRATRAMSESQLLDASLPRLTALADEGVTTVEIKSGYGLTPADELKMLRVARRMAEHVPINITTTLLAAHALPPEFQGRADDYVALVCDEIIPAAAAEGLADAVDVFCERIAFSTAQCERVFEAARRHGLPVKGHVEQLSNLGGARLAARFAALSVDHLEYLGAADVQALADSGTTAVLLPGAFYFLRETQKPPVAQLRAAGVPMAVSTDLNPGTSPLCSLRLMLNMACTLFGLTPEEALVGATRSAARALGLADRIGTLTVGKQADFLVWDVDHPSELVCEFGVPRLRQRVFRGETKSSGLSN
ncbi:MAG: imidazolonepropionase [Planctomycetales bacterium]|nr:imidazolonepropionase [Planctomycetales bacterium]